MAYIASEIKKIELTSCFAEGLYLGYMPLACIHRLGYKTLSIPNVDAKISI